MSAGLSASSLQSENRVIKISPELRLTTTVGNRAFSQLIGENVTVVAFIAVNCPISNAYAPDFAALQRDLRKQGGNLVLVYSNAGDIAEAPEHVRQYSLSECPIVLDQDQVVASAFHATMTPEMYVVKDYQVVYQGRMDDRFIGRTRPSGNTSRTSELKNAVTAILANREVKLAKTKVFGCAIERTLPNGQKGPTYYSDVKGVLERSCVRCHDASGVAPMTFATYAGARRYANNIASVVAQRQMPPWKAEPSVHSYSNLRSISDADRNLLMQWAATGALAGEPSTKSAATVPIPQMSWDIELTTSAVHKIKASGIDEYRTFVIPTDFNEDRWIDAVDYKPSNPKVVHRILGFVDSSKGSRRYVDSQATLGYSNFGGLLTHPDAELGAWYPGNPLQGLRKGTAWKLPKGADILVQVHYHPTGKVEEDAPKIRLRFTGDKVTQPRKLLTLSRNDLFLPAGSVKTYSISHKVDQTSFIHSILPHMHLIGKSITVTVQTPENKVTQLLAIKDWDIYWQEAYLFENPVLVPAGSTITVTAQFDNSIANPRQPNAPPANIHHGETNKDEKMLVYIGYTDQP